MYDLIIIGGGPAGLSAAMYAARGNLKVLVLERAVAGGKVFTTHLVENYPGFSSISGRELAKTLEDSCLKYGAEFKIENVKNLIKEEDKFKITTTINEYLAKKVIIATGTDNRQLGVEGEKIYTGRGVSYCAICDGNFFRNKKVAVIGGGNSALEEALYLADICESVTIVHRRDEFRAEKYIQEKISQKENISLVLNSTLKEIKGDGTKVNSIEIETINGEIKTIEVSGVFIYIGLKANTEEFMNFDIYDDNNNIIVDEKMETKVKGLYGAGDVNKKKLRQIVTATGDGAVAAQSVIEELK